jgi:hypothetical protein
MATNYLIKRIGKIKILKKHNQQPKTIKSKVKMTKKQQVRENEGRQTPINHYEKQY